MSEKVLHRVFGTNVIEGWRVVQVDAVASAGSAVFALFDSGSNVGREMLVNELAYLAARVDELEAEKAKLRARVKSLLRGIEVQRDPCTKLLVAYDAARAALDAEGDAGPTEER